MSQIYRYHNLRQLREKVRDLKFVSYAQSTFLPTGFGEKVAVTVPEKQRMLLDEILGEEPGLVGVAVKRVAMGIIDAAILQAAALGKEEAEQLLAELAEDGS